MTMSQVTVMQMNVLVESLLEGSPTLEWLVENWVVSQGNGLCLSQVEADTEPVGAAPGIFAAELQCNRSAIATVFFKKDDLLAQYPGVAPFSDYILDWNADPSYSPGSVAAHAARWPTFDEEGLSTRDRKLGIEFSDALFAPIGPISALYPVVTGYLLSYGGSVQIQPTAHSMDAEYWKGVLPQMQAENLALSRLISTYESYTSPASSCCVRSHSYFRVDREIPEPAARIAGAELKRTRTNRIAIQPARPIAPQRQTARSPARQKTLQTN